jgi:hypothetical protein
LPLPSGLDPSDYGLDTLTWRLVNPDALSANDQIVSVPIPNGSDVPDWTAADFVGDGKQKLEEQFMDFESPFAFCLRLNLPLHGPTTPDPDVLIKLRASADLTFTPL